MKHYSQTQPVRGLQTKRKGCRLRLLAGDRWYNRAAVRNLCSLYCLPIRVLQAVWIAQKLKMHAITFFGADHGAIFNLCRSIPLHGWWASPSFFSFLLTSTYGHYLIDCTFERSAADRWKFNSIELWARLGSRACKRCVLPSQRLKRRTGLARRSSACDHAWEALQRKTARTGFHMNRMAKKRDANESQW